MVARNPIVALRSSRAGARLLAALGAPEAPPAALVGGAVRDLLLGREPRELDVVVEGPLDPIAEALGGVRVDHDRFGTARIAVEGDEYDLAQARSETYARPGALPDVRPATLEEDLRRRDVTVNAIALRPDGTLVAVPGALDDLAAGLLRVLHDASFLDDPTRLWRMARYQARLGFTVEPHTAALAAAAVADSALDTVSGPRIGAELRLALGEPDPDAALLAAAELALLPAAVVPPGPVLDVARGLLPAGGRPDLLTLAAWSTGAEPVGLRTWLDALAFSADDRDVVLAAAAAPGRLAFPARPSALAAALRGAPVEAVALAAAAGGPDAATAARRWLDELRHVRLEIGGDDLLAAGVVAGPALGLRLDRALAARLDGDAPDRTAQLDVALQEDET